MIKRERKAHIVVPKTVLKVLESGNYVMFIFVFSRSWLGFRHILTQETSVKQQVNSEITFQEKYYE